MAEARKNALAEARTKHIVFTLVLDKSTLIERNAYMWGEETLGHTAPHVLPSSLKGGKDKFPFFTT